MRNPRISRAPHWANKLPDLVDPSIIGLYNLPNIGSVHIKSYEDVVIAEVYAHDEELRCQIGCFGNERYGRVLGKGSTWSMWEHVQDKTRVAEFVTAIYG